MKRERLLAAQANREGGMQFEEEEESDDDLRCDITQDSQEN